MKNRQVKRSTQSFWVFASVVSLLAAIVAASGSATAATIRQNYVLLPDQMIEVRGGITGGSSLASVEGSLSFEIDVDADVATLVAFDLTLDGGAFPTLQGIPFVGLSGTIDDATSTLSFLEPGLPGLSWTFSPLGAVVGDQLSWLGSFSNGFPDGFIYEFAEGTPGSGGPGGGGPTGPSGPALLVLVPEPTTAVLLALGLVGLRAGSPRRYVSAGSGELPARTPEH